MRDHWNDRRMGHGGGDAPDFCGKLYNTVLYLKNKTQSLQMKKRNKGICNQRVLLGNFYLLSFIVIIKGVYSHG